MLICLGALLLDRAETRASPFFLRAAPRTAHTVRGVESTGPPHKRRLYVPCSLTAPYSFIDATQTLCIHTNYTGLLTVYRRHSHILGPRDKIKFIDR